MSVDSILPPLSEIHHRLPGATVLVADDMPQTRRAITRILQRAGAVVVEAADGIEALALLRGKALDLALLDIDMPGLSGLQLCERIRQDETPPRLPVLFITGREEEARHLAAFAAGCDDFLAKPVVPAVLVARVANLIARRTAELENLRMVRALSRYVPAPARDAQRVHEVAALVGTILFSDLRGFTAAALTVDPRQLFRVLCQLYTAQAHCVQSRGGYVDKFSGDGMLAVFTDEGHCAQACHAAQDIRAWGREFVGPMPWLPMPIGLGIATGSFLRGDMGCDEHMEMTVIGPTVNMAARLCGHASALDVLATTDVRNQAGDGFAFDGPEQTNIKGIFDQVPVWRLL